MFRYSDSSLSPYEREQREVERLINKKPRPSQKNRPKRGPKHDNRRQRMKDPSEVSKPDKDLSLNYKNIGGSSLADIALNIFLSADKKENPYQKEENAYKQIKSELNKYSTALSNDWADIIWKDYFSFLKLGSKDKLTTLKQILNETKNDINDNSQIRTISNKFYEAGDPKDINNIIRSSYVSGPGNWGKKVSFLRGLKSSIERLERSGNIPAYLSAVFTQKPGQSLTDDKELLRQVTEGASGAKSIKSIKSGLAARFAMVSAVNNVLSRDPFTKIDNIDQAVNDAYERITKEMNELREAQNFMDMWGKAASDFAKVTSGEPWKYNLDNLEKVGKKLEKFQNQKDNEFIDIGSIVNDFEAYAKETYGEVPKELNQFFEGYQQRAASNKNYFSKPMRKTAAFHGFVKQNHPESPFPGWMSLDKRYFTKENYDSIVASAKDLLKEPWYKEGWEGGSPDAPIRAALDIAIQTSDDNLYQSKIDVETYNMLLNKLAGYDFDVFEETLYNKHKGSRRNSSMSNRAVQEILRVASTIRKSNPTEAAKLLRSIRAMTEEGEMDPTKFQPAASDKPESEPAEKPEATSADLRSLGEQFGEMDKAKLDKAHKDLMDALNKEDVDAFVDAFQEMDSEVKKHHAAARIAAELIEFKSLSALDPEELKKVLTEAKKEAEVLKKGIDDLDIEMFLTGFNDMAQTLKKSVASGFLPLKQLSIYASSAIDQVRAVASWGSFPELGALDEELSDMAMSAYVDVDYLERIASTNPAVQKALAHVFAAAKKKKTSKKPKKKDEKKKPAKKEEKSDKPFGGKQAPPFMKGNKLKKASIQITEDDLNW